MNNLLSIGDDIGFISKTRIATLVSAMGISVSLALGTWKYFTDDKLTGLETTFENYSTSNCRLGFPAEYDEYTGKPRHAPYLCGGVLDNLVLERNKRMKELGVYCVGKYWMKKRGGKIYNKLIMFSNISFGKGYTGNS